MSYSEVTSKLESAGFDQCFLDYFTDAEHCAAEVDRLSEELRQAEDSRRMAAGNLEYLTMAISRDAEYSDLIERVGQANILRVVSGNSCI